MLHIICNGKPVQLPDGKGLSKADDEFLTKMMDGPSASYESDRKPSSAGRSKPAAADRLRHHSQWISDQ